MAEHIDTEKPKYSLDELLAITDEEIEEMDAQAVRVCLHAIDHYSTSFGLADLAEKLYARIENL